MQKKILIPIAIVVVLLLALFVPIPTGKAGDGGTKVYSALTYKIVAFDELYHDGRFTKTKLYFGEDAKKSVDELLDAELENVECKLLAKFGSFTGQIATVYPLISEKEFEYSEGLSFNISGLDILGLSSNEIVEVTYKGKIPEEPPKVINATSWRITDITRYSKYERPWLDEKTAKKSEVGIEGYFSLQELYSDCFFCHATATDGRVVTVKFNVDLSDDWCYGDDVNITYENLYEDAQGRMECDVLTMELDETRWEDVVCAKPVIYFYPEEETPVSVKLDYDGRLTCTYPEYEDGWKVTALPDGTLIGEDGKIYNYLYWEGVTDAQFDMSQGFCIKGEDTAEFLEVALEKLGLSRREANEFIVYWLPLMQENEYNVISFQTDAYTECAKLDVSPAPDTLIRVFMAWKASDELVDIQEQELTAPERNGFTVVEWGGTEIK